MGSSKLTAALLLLLSPAASAFSLIAADLAPGSTTTQWIQSHATFAVNYADCGASEAEINKIIDSAMQIWNSVPTSSLQLKRSGTTSITYADLLLNQNVNESQLPVIVCDPDLGLHVDGPIAGVGSPGWIVVDGHVFSQYSELAAAVLVAHELGHAIGLGHSNDGNSIMHPGNYQTQKLSLSQDDAAGVAYLYPRDELGGSGMLGCGTLERADSGESPPSPPGGSAGAFEFAGFVLLAWLATRRGQAVPLAVAGAAGVLAITSCSKSPQLGTDRTGVEFPVNIPASMTIDGTDAIYVAGNQAPSGSSIHWLVRKSSDSAQSWSTLDDFEYSADAVSTQVESIVSDSLGNLFASGAATDSGSTTHWLVRASSDGGTTWSTVDDLTAAPNDGEIAPGAIGVDASSKVYVVGSQSPADGTYLWQIRGSADHGLTWATLGSYKTPASSSKSVLSGDSRYRVAFGRDHSGNLLMAGTVPLSSGTEWVIAKSTDGGAGWNTLAEFQYAAGDNSALRGLGSDASGNLYAFGSAASPSSSEPNAHWLVRESTDGGSTWRTVDDYLYPSSVSGSPTAAAAYAFGSDSSGNLYIAGAGEESPGTGIHWITRKSSDHGSSWSTIDDFQYTPNLVSEALAIGADTSGGVFVAGVGKVGEDYAWLLRKSSSSGTSWSTPDQFFYGGQ